MIDQNNLAKWLTNQFGKFNPILTYVAVFGSFAYGSHNPGDCDILIVLNSPVSNSQYLLVRNSLIDIKKRFEDYWNIRLSPTVMTLDEVYEKGNFITSIFKRPLIDIFGFKIDLYDNRKIMD